jgi:proline racemase
MFERRAYAQEHLDDLRRLLMFEPRGHHAMSGAILMPPADSRADLGVLFIEVTGFLPMCGHGTIGVCTVAVERGLVPVREPETTISLDTPAGIVEARVAVKDGRAQSVTLTNVPSYLALRDADVDVPGMGTVRFDLAYGGNFYAIVEARDAGLTLGLDEAPAIVERGMRIMEAIRAQHRFSHPLEPRICELRHVLFSAPPTIDGAHSRGSIVLAPGQLDRSPCGTGTSARMAQRHARGEQRPGETFVHESILGTPFYGTIERECALAPGIGGIVPSVRGRAWISGYASYVLAEDDPFPRGFLIPTA